MELTLESALSPGGFVGHMSYLLLVISMLMRSITWLRILVIASALCAIAYDTIWLKDPVGVFWETLLVTVNVVQIARIWLADRRARFSATEMKMLKQRFPDLAPSDARNLLNLGMWVDGEEGTQLTVQAQPVSHLVYLASGRVDIRADGRLVGYCGPGNFVGELSLIGQGLATASAVVAEPAHYWMISTETVKDLREKGSPLFQAIEVGIAHDLKSKIVTGNRSDPPF